MLRILNILILIAVAALHVVGLLNYARLADTLTWEQIRPFVLFGGLVVPMAGVAAERIRLRIQSGALLGVGTILLCIGFYLWDFVVSEPMPGELRWLTFVVNIGFYGMALIPIGLLARRLPPS